MARPSKKRFELSIREINYIKKQLGITKIEDVDKAAMKNLTWRNTKSVTKLKEVKYEKGLTINKKEMKMLEDKYITRTDGIKKWSVLITP